MNLELYNSNILKSIPKNIQIPPLYELGSYALVIKFNKRGTLLAVGCHNGKILLWDFLTQGLSRSWKGHVRPITSLSWINNGKQLLTSSIDHTLKLWDMKSQTELKSYDLKTQILNAQIHPKGKVCIVCPNMEWPILLDLTNGKITQFPGRDDMDTSEDKNKKSAKTKLESLGAAIFSKKGDKIYFGTESGEIFVLSTDKLEILKRVSLSTKLSTVGIKQLSLSRKDNYMLVNGTDRVLRLYDIPDLAFIREFKDNVNKRQWKTCSFSNDDKFIIGGSYDSSEHRIHVWDFTYGNVEILEGPKETIVDLCWHPVFPVIVSASNEGVVYIWNCDFSESWSSYAPNFVELQENQEYVEREDEFDLVEEEKLQKMDDENEVLDIETIDKYSDEEEEELLYLPVVIERDHY